MMTRIRRRLCLTIVLFGILDLLVLIDNMEYVDKLGYRTEENATLHIVEDTESSKLNQSKTVTVEILSNASIAVILAYMRSGSSLTGACLQAVPKTFYLFEPIRNNPRYRAEENNKLNLAEDTGSSKLNQSKTVEILSNASIAVILAYMRSGSSLTGACLQAVPKTFYLFEPIRSIVAQFVTAPDPVVPILYPNGTTIHYNKEDEHDVMMQEIENYLTCNFGNLSAASLCDRFHNKTTLMIKLQRSTLLHGKVGIRRSMKPLFTLRIDKPLFSLENWTRCLEEVRQDCLTAPVRAVKFIRIPMSDIKTLMPKFPNMKVLHLNRDPRASYNSRLCSNMLPPIYFKGSVNQHCKRWFKDIEVMKDLAKEYPGRVRSLRYEDIAQNPEEMFKNISNFFGMDFEPDIKDFLINMTNVTEDGGPMDFKRADPLQTSIQWRNIMNFTEVQYINQRCAAGMREMNYLQFSNEQDMRNLDLPFLGPLNNIDGNS